MCTSFPLSKYQQYLRSNHWHTTHTFSTPTLFGETMAAGYLLPRLILGTHWCYSWVGYFPCQHMYTQTKIDMYTHRHTTQTLMHAHAHTHLHTHSTNTEDCFSIQMLAICKYIKHCQRGRILLIYNSLHGRSI